MQKHLLILILLALGISSGAWGQKISYDPPKEYRKVIAAADYQLLVDSAVAVVGRRYPIEKVADGTITLRAGQADATAFNLRNILATCAAEPDRRAWGPLIRHHFTSLFSSLDAQKKLDPSSYESMRGYLSLRVYPEALVAQRGGAQNLVTRVDLPGTVTMLMLDLPGTFSAVPQAGTAQWHQETAALFAQAQANVNKQAVQKVTKDFDGPNKQKLTFHFLGNEDYAASYALDLGADAPEMVGEWGSAVAMPNKGLVSICPISRARPLDFVQYIQLSQAAIAKAYQEHAQPVSPDFYWYYQGKFTRIPVVTDKDGHVNVLSPLGLSALMTAK